ncbi:kinase-like protein [Glonium stellatum]|uniref:Kinase-like protein n=1 Tax=Glonium stellatum TaxID=574774 RepID=A0A8E2JS16_9PEZI|nr:kinase-like protein [Glonium stellatum]
MRMETREPPLRSDERPLRRSGRISKIRIAERAVGKLTAKPTEDSSERWSLQERTPSEEETHDAVRRSTRSRSKDLKDENNVISTKSSLPYSQARRRSKRTRSPYLTLSPPPRPRPISIDISPTAPPITQANRKLYSIAIDETRAYREKAPSPTPSYKIMDQLNPSSRDKAADIPHKSLEAAVGSREQETDPLSPRHVNPTGWMLYDSSALPLVSPYLSSSYLLSEGLSSNYQPPDYQWRPFIPDNAGVGWPDLQADTLLPTLFVSTADYSRYPLPATTPTLSHGLIKYELNPSSRDKATDILYKSLEDIVRECGWQWDHCVFVDAREAPLTLVRSLGHGSLGVVEEVSIASQNKSTFVRKRVQIPYSNREQILRIIKREAAVMAKLIHPHITKIIGSYEDKSAYRIFYSLLSYPVGDSDLKTFLEILGEQQADQDESSYGTPVVERREWLWTWFGCLAGALDYMHDSGVRHQDVKPSNIVHRGRNIYFTDFSSADEFRVGHTTSTESPACTSDMYSAPEVFEFGERHGLGTDIFSLGCVFLEMLTVLCQTTVASFQEFCCTDVTKPNNRSRVLLYRNSLGQVREWFSHHEAHQEIYKTIECMLEQKREDRPRAQVVLRSMLELTYPKRVEIICPCHTTEGHFGPG